MMIWKATVLALVLVSGHAFAQQTTTVSPQPGGRGALVCPYPLRPHDVCHWDATIKYAPHVTAK